MSLHLYVLPVPFLWLFVSLSTSFSYSGLLFKITLFCYFLDACLFSNDRKCEDVGEWRGRTDPRGVREAGQYHNIIYENIFSIKRAAK